MVVDYSNENLDCDIRMAAFCLKLMQEFRATHEGYPPEFDDSSDYDLILQKIIWSFEMILDPDWETEVQDIYSTQVDPEFTPEFIENDLINWLNRDKTPEEQLQDINFVHALELVNQQINEGLFLFGKYFRSFW